MAIAGSLLLIPSAFAAEIDMEPADMGSVTVDATVYHLATPDIVNMSLSCEAPTPGTKAAIRRDFRDMLQAMISTVGSDGTVRRNGTPVVYPYYGPIPLPLDSNGMPLPDSGFGGSLNVSVLNIKNGAGQRIGDAMEEMGCSVTWDVRMLYTAKYSRQHRAELFEQLADKKEFFEDLLGTPLAKVSNIYFSTMPDSSGYYGSPASYDPESNSLPVMTTLSVTYDIGTARASR